MAEIPNASFIPKRGPVKRARRVVSRQVYLFTFVSYILIFAALLSAGGIFFYHAYLERERTVAIEALSAEIASFSETNLQRVREFERRLQQANARINASVSISSLFAALEQATVETVSFSEFQFERFGDERIAITATVGTDSFDSVIFQREVVKANDILGELTISELAIRDQSNIEASDEAATPESAVHFIAKLDVPLDRIPFEPAALQPPVESFTPSAPAATSTPDDVVGGLSDDSGAANEGLNENDL